MRRCSWWFRYMRTHPCMQFPIFLLFFACYTAGCGTLPNGRGWGQDATLTPGWDRISRAAWDAAASPATWGPAVGALAFQVGSADRNLAQWAMVRTPLYGSQRNAAHASDALGSAISAAYVVTAVATPSGDRSGRMGSIKSQGICRRVWGRGDHQSVDRPAERSDRKDPSQWI